MRSAQTPIPASSDNLLESEGGRFAKYYSRQEFTYKKLVKNEQHLDYPRMVSIETLAFCNAACSFCPYPTLENKGDKMPTEIVYKIIDELVVPGKLPQALTFVRVNEPFLDKRIFDFMRYVETRLPGCPCPQTTNGTPLNDSVLDKLASLKNIPWLKVSFNDHDPDRYQQTMKLPFHRTVENLDRLHDRVQAGEILFKVIVGRVGNGSSHDTEFKAWCKERYPRFEVRVTRPFDWIGEVKDVTVFEPPNTGCLQWFDLHFLANGTEAFCCIDSKGLFPDQTAYNTNVLDIFNRPFRRKLRERAMLRNDVDICRGCTY